MQTDADIKYPARRAGFFKYLEFLKRPEEVQKRFWAKVDKRGPDECWPWVGARDKQGYGHFSAAGKRMHAHRFSWEIVNGPMPADKDGMHSCDNPWCVNPSHTKPGTTLENIQDAIAKGRWVVKRGEEHGEAKFTTKEVLEIRRIHATGEKTMAQMARELGVDHECIRMIVKRITWKHI